MSDVQLLLAEREIKNVVLRYCRGVDRMDLALVRSCYHPDADDHHGDFAGGVNEALHWCGTCSRPTHRPFTWWRTCWSRSIRGRPDSRAARATGWRCTSTEAKAAVGAKPSASGGSMISSGGRHRTGRSSGVSRGGWRPRSGSTGSRRASSRPFPTGFSRAVGPQRPRLPAGRPTEQTGGAVRGLRSRARQASSATPNRSA